MTAPPSANTDFLRDIGLPTQEVTIGRPNRSGRGGRNNFADNLTTFQGTQRGKANKNTSEGPHETGEQRKRREAAELLPVFYNEGELRGADYPRGAGVPKLNQNIPCYVLVSGVDSLFLSNLYYEYGYRSKYGLSSQNPSTQVSEYIPTENMPLPPSFNIFREHLTKIPMETDQETGETSFRVMLQGRTTDLDPKNVKDLLQLGLHFKDVPDHLVKSLIDDSTRDGCVGGLNAFSFRVRKGASFPRESGLGRDITRYACRGVAHIAFIRFDQDCIGAMDDFFAGQMERCLNGPYWFYRDYLEGTKHPWINTLKKHMTSGGNPIPIPPWQYAKSQEGKLIVVSEPKLLTFASNADYRNIMSIGLLREYAAASAAEMTHYGHTKPHKAVIHSVTENGVVVARFKITGFEGVGNPPVPTEEMTLRIWKQSPEGDAMLVDQPSEEPMNGVQLPIRTKGKEREQLPMEGDSAVPTQQSTTAAPVEWKADRLDEEDLPGQFDFSVSFAVQDAQRDLFQKDREIEFTIAPSLNALSVERQLKAVEWMSRDLRPTDRDFELQAAIMGRKVKRFSAMPLWNRCEDESWRKLAQEYFSRTGLNVLQRQCVYKLFMGEDILTLIQGPPGTGKSVTDGVISTMVILLRFNCLVVAPSNRPVLSLMEKIIQQEKFLESIHAGISKHYNIIYFPTLSVTKVELQTDKTKSTKANENLRFHHSSYIKQWFLDHKGDAQDPANEQQRNCRLWLVMNEKIEKGSSLNDEELQWYLKQIDTVAPKVFLEAKVPFIVASTCNNSAQLRDWGVKIDALVGDEIAFGLEADTNIPFSLGPLRVVLSGDHKQFNAVTRCKGLSERDEQTSISMFERLQQLYKSGLIILRINYRMHPRITVLPACLTYDWLGSEGVNAYEMSEAALFMEEFWLSPACLLFRENRVQTNQREPFGDWRRLAFATDGTSAPAPGGTSLRNFANINCICAIIQLMINHKGKYKFNPDWVLIGTMYRDQLGELEKQFGIRFKGVEAAKYLRCDTLHKLQGSEARIFLHEYTPANEHNPAMFGFNSDFRRENVALTRGMDAVWVVGSFFRHFEQIHIINSDPRPRGLKLWGLFFAHLRLKNDLVDVRAITAKNLPIDEDEFRSKPNTEWSREIEKMSKEDSEFSQSWAKEMRDLGATSSRDLKYLQDKAWQELNRELEKKLQKFRQMEQDHQDDLKNEMSLDLDTEVESKIQEASETAAAAIQRQQDILGTLDQEDQATGGS